MYTFLFPHLGAISLQWQMVSINNSPKETFSEKSYGFYKSWCSSKNAGHLYYNANLIGITAIKTALKVSLNGYIWQNWTIITELDK